MTTIKLQNLEEEWNKPIKKKGKEFKTIVDLERWHKLAQYKMEKIK